MLLTHAATYSVCLVSIGCDNQVSSSGAPCKLWIIDSAIRHRDTPYDKPFDGLATYYCRNPDGEGNSVKAAAWCYVEAKEGEVDWEYCNVPSCKDCGSRSQNMADYTGTQSKTRTGKTCIRWEGTEHLLVDENITIYREIIFSGVPLLYQYGIQRAYNLEENYCRNPLPYQRDTVFCYVNESGDWEYCDDVPECDETGSTSMTCGSQEVRQADYRGSVNVTSSGRPCRAWSEQEEYTTALYPDAGLDDGAYCRQPAGSQRLGAWCYVNTSDLTWEYCDVEIC